MTKINAGTCGNCLNWQYIGESLFTNDSIGFCDLDIPQDEVEDWDFEREAVMRDFLYETDSCDFWQPTDAQDCAPKENTE